MRYMAVPVSFRWDEDFVKRIDGARGDVPRSRFVRRAVEQALGEGRANSTELPSSAPAEQPREYKGHIVRSSSARPFRPAPKGKQ